MNDMFCLVSEYGLPNLKMLFVVLLAGIFGLFIGFRIADYTLEFFDEEGWRPPVFFALSMIAPCAFLIGSWVIASMLDRFLCNAAG